MRRSLALVLAIGMALTVFTPQSSLAARVRVERGPRRVLVIVRPGHPIRRAMHSVIFRRPNVVVRVGPTRFLPVVLWRPIVVVARPVGAHLAWQDAETLSRNEDWSETVFDSNQRGDKLFLEVVQGRAQFDFAEVVFENGDCQVVDFNNGLRGPGLYGLLDFANGRMVDHVRLIARSQSEHARVALLLRK